ncbi:hypothetical protein H8D91_01485 [archaeon]|nr:hypothetical protein [archaeon]
MVRKFDLGGLEKIEQINVAKEIVSSLFPQQGVEDIGSIQFRVGTSAGYGPEVSFDFLHENIAIGYHFHEGCDVTNTRGAALRISSALEPIFKPVGYDIYCYNVED